MTGTVKYLVERGIPVIGHIGLLPQSINNIGGYKFQGRDEKSRKKLKNDALALQESGAFAIVIEGVGNLLTTLARCCQPLPGDAIVGYITRGRGVSIHRADCASFARLRARDASRVIEVEWGGARTQAYEVDLLVRGYDRKWLHKDVTNVIAAANVHLIAVNTRVDASSGIATMNFAIRVADFEQLSTLLGRLSGVPNVIESRRLA